SPQYSTTPSRQTALPPAGRDRRAQQEEGLATALLVDPRRPAERGGAPASLLKIRLGRRKCRARLGTGELYGGDQRALASTRRSPGIFGHGTRRVATWTRGRGRRRLDDQAHLQGRAGRKRGPRRFDE